MNNSGGTAALSLGAIVSNKQVNDAALVVIALVLLLLIAGGAFYFVQASWLAREQAAVLRAEAEAQRAVAKAERAERLARQADKLRGAETGPGPAGDSPEGVRAADRGEAVEADAASLEEAIVGVLTAQIEAWNSGDIEAFMNHYWRSEQLTFAAAGELRRGWDATRARYLARYPTAEAMGSLAFGELEIQPLGASHALVLGSWHVSRDEGDLGGRFSLVFANVEGRWVIQHDHTSRADP